VFTARYEVNLNIIQVNYSNAYHSTPPNPLPLSLTEYWCKWLSGPSTKFTINRARPGCVATYMGSCAVGTLSIASMLNEGPRHDEIRLSTWMQCSTHSSLRYNVPRPDKYLTGDCVTLTATVDTREISQKCSSCWKQNSRHRSRPARNVSSHLTGPTSSILPWRTIFYNDRKLFFYLPQFCTTMLLKH